MLGYTHIYIALCIIHDSINKNSNIIMKNYTVIYTIQINNEYVSSVPHDEFFELFSIFLHIIFD